MIRDFIQLFGEHLVLVPLAFLGLLILIDQVSCFVLNGIQYWRSSSASDTQDPPPSARPKQKGDAE